MAMKTKEARAAEKAAETDPPAKNDLVHLRDQDTGFFDPATGFQVVRDQKVKLDGEIGNATRIALQSGRLLVVED